MEKESKILKLTDLENNHVAYIQEHEMLQLLSDLEDYYNTLSGHGKEREMCQNLIERIHLAPSGRYNN